MPRAILDAVTGDERCPRGYGTGHLSPIHWRADAQASPLSPYFSTSGDQVVWSKLTKPSVGEPGKFFGEWELHVAAFNIDGTPKLTDDRVLLSHQLFEAHGFSPDGRRLLYSSDRGLEFSGGLDLFEYDLETGDTRNLTDSPTSYDEHARQVPYRSVTVDPGPAEP